ncbi:MAG TPA: tRNA (adenosine(37)-N6)-threonylcarbamoyltransferase complex transferase subunit TsaD [Saprospiraceae bacterium]|nr:tRNA (adenosine(37)-N6)-threonylcarbamoyltransferase complex transferase subunit TsaD [Saprospiraceae bacterium]
MEKSRNGYLLAIESSCDDSSAAIFKGRQLLSNIISSQLDHRDLGGVVPELASRKHLENIQPVVEQALKKAGIGKSELKAIAYTQGPGLLGSLLVGAGYAKGLALSHQLPLIGIHHMEAHVLAHFIEDPHPRYPFLCLLVSGGHTQLVIMHDAFEMEVVGKTIDDAAGEAFDKTGKILGLPYPAGPEIDRLAQKGKARFKFTTPSVDGLNFSFSGLKTSILYFLRDEKKKNPDFIEQNLTDICASVQKTIVDYLLLQLEKAMEQYGLDRVAIAGGVSANSELRRRVQGLKNIGAEVFILPMKYCVDNAGMIGMAGVFKWEKEMYTTLDAPVFTK